MERIPIQRACRTGLAFVLLASCVGGVLVAAASVVLLREVMS